MQNFYQKFEVEKKEEKFFLVNKDTKETIKISEHEAVLFEDIKQGKKMRDIVIDSLVKFEKTPFRVILELRSKMYKLSTTGGMRIKACAVRTNLLPFAIVFTVASLILLILKPPTFGNVILNFVLAYLLSSLALTLAGFLSSDENVASLKISSGVINLAWNGKPTTKLYIVLIFSSIPCILGYAGDTGILSLYLLLTISSIEFTIIPRTVALIIFLGFIIPHLELFSGSPTSLFFSWVVALGCLGIVGGTAFKLRRPKRTVEWTDISMLKEYIISVPIFSDLDDEELETIVRNSLVRLYMRKEDIVRQGEEGKEFFIILEGEVGVFKEDDGREIQLATLKPRDSFGEITLLYGIKRTATCRALSDVKTLVISQWLFSKFLPKFKGGERIENTLRISESMRRNPFFQELSGKTMSKIIMSSEEVEFSEGEVILREGEFPEEIWLIREGEAEVLKGDEKLATLKDGDIFGEIAVLKGGVRTATIKTLKPTRALKIPAEKFWEILEDDVFFGAALERIAELRQAHQ